MFSNLSKGSVLYGLDTRGEVKLFVGSVEQVTPPVPINVQNTFGRVPNMVVDITAIINGERREFKQVPSNNAIADFGSNTFVLADNKDSLINYVNATLQTSKNIVNSVDLHKKLISQYESILGELNPNSNDSAIKELRQEVDMFKNQLAEAIALLKQGNNKTE